MYKKCKLKVQLKKWNPSFSYLKIHWMRLLTRLKKRDSQNIKGNTCLQEWRKISFLWRSILMKMISLLRTKQTSMRLSNRNKGKSRKKNFNHWLSSKDLWRILRKNKETDKIESMSFISVSKIKKSLFKRESKDKGETKRLLKQLQMKIRMLQSSKWEKIFTSRNYGTNSWGKRWREKWNLQFK